MKRSIKSLPKRTQQELNVLIELISQNMKDCEMIILYGSYARGEHVFWDDRIEFGTHTTFQSDLDILVITSYPHPTVIQKRLDEDITDKYNKILEKLKPTHPNSVVIRYAPPEFIVEHIKTINRELENCQYFYTDIIKDGIVIYDTKKYKLAKPKKLSYQEIKDIAQEEYEAMFESANEFLKGGYFYFREGNYKTGSFLLHQACEKYYNSIALACNNYSHKTHYLAKLLRKTKKYAPDLVSVFPLNTDFEKRCYDLICRAYIEGRYNKSFVVTNEEYEYLLARIEILKEIVERTCKEQMERYDAVIEREKEMADK